MSEEKCQQCGVAANIPHTCNGTYFDARKELGIKPDAKVDTRKPTHGPCCTCQRCGYDSIIRKESKNE